MLSPNPSDQSDHTDPTPGVMSGVLLCGDSRLSHRPLTYHSHEAEIVTRARYFTEKCTRTTAHDRSVHHAATRVTCGTIRASCVGAVSRRYYARKGKFHPARTHAIEQSCMCEAHGGADRNSRRDLPRQCKEMHAWSCSGTVRARSDAPASMCRPRTQRCPRSRSPLTRAPVPSSQRTWAELCSRSHRAASAWSSLTSQRPCLVEPDVAACTGARHRLHPARRKRCLQRLSRRRFGACAHSSSAKSLTVRLRSLLAVRVPIRSFRCR